MSVEDIIEQIDAKLAGPGRDEDKLTPPEYALFLAHGFDDHVRAEDFTSFVSERSPEEWTASRDALRMVGAAGYGDVLGRFIAADGADFFQQGSLPAGSEEFEFSEDYDSSLVEVRADSGNGDDYMELILQAFAERSGIGV